MAYTCPVCNYSGLSDPPYNEHGFGSYEICPCCGFEFGVDDDPDKESGIMKWRERWIGEGKKWWSEDTPPADWDAEAQTAIFDK